MTATTPQDSEGFNTEVLGRLTTYLSQFDEFQPSGDDSADQAFANIFECIEKFRNVAPTVPAEQTNCKIVGGEIGGLVTVRLDSGDASLHLRTLGNSAYLSESVLAPSQPVAPYERPQFDPIYVHQMWATVRRHDSTIPSDVLDSMREILMSTSLTQPVVPAEQKRYYETEPDGSVHEIDPADYESVPVQPVAPEVPTKQQREDTAPFFSPSIAESDCATKTKITKEGDEYVLSHYFKTVKEAVDAAFPAAKDLPVTQQREDSRDAARRRAFRDRDNGPDLFADDFTNNFRENADTLVDEIIVASTDERKEIMSRFLTVGDSPAPPLLKWTEHQKPCERCRYDHVEAATPFGPIVITWKGWKECPGYSVEEAPWGDDFSTHDSLEKAIQAVEETYRRKLSEAISSVLEDAGT